jgi:hypothetical protein
MVPKAGLDNQFKHLILNKKQQTITVNAPLCAPAFFGEIFIDILSLNFCIARFK